jgi:hypothetical protein
LKARIELFGMSLALAYIVGAFVVSVAAVGIMIYCGLNDKWLPAIFTLLARREIVRWLHAESDRLMKLHEKPTEDSK